MGATLLLTRRWTLPPGALTLVFTLNAVAMGFLYDVGFYPLAQVAARVAAGAIADTLYRQLRPSIQRIGALRAFSFAVPAVAFGLYFVASHVAAGIGWTIQPSYPVGTVSDFVRPVNEYPDLMLRLFATDSLFVLSYLMVFVGLYVTVADNGLFSPALTLPQTCI